MIKEEQKRGRPVLKQDAVKWQQEKTKFDAEIVKFIRDALVELKKSKVRDLGGKLFNFSEEKSVTQNVFNIKLKNKRGLIDEIVIRCCYDSYTAPLRVLFFEAGSQFGPSRDKFFDTAENCLKFSAVLLTNTLAPIEKEREREI